VDEHLNILRVWLENAYSRPESNGDDKPKQPLLLGAREPPFNTPISRPTPFTTARSNHALPHNDVIKSPVVTMGRSKFTPKLPLSLQRSSPPSNAPITRLTPLAIRNGVRIHSAVLPQ